VHVKDELAQLKDYVNRDVGIVGISSNDVSNYPDDAPESLKAMAVELGLPFPVCYESQETAKATHSLYARLLLVRCQPTASLSGQMDDSRPSNGKLVTGEDLRAAMDAVLAGKPVNPEAQHLL